MLHPFIRVYSIYYIPDTIESSFPAIKLDIITTIYEYFVEYMHIISDFRLKFEYEYEMTMVISWEENCSFGRKGVEIIDSSD